LCVAWLMALLDGAGTDYTFKFAWLHNEPSA
jgi:hypothetical protein